MIGLGWIAVIDTNGSCKAYLCTKQHRLSSVLSPFCEWCAGPILSTADIYKEEQYRQRNMFQVTKPPEGEQI